VAFFIFCADQQGEYRSNTTYDNEMMWPGRVCMLSVNQMHCTHIYTVNWQASDGQSKYLHSYDIIYLLKTVCNREWLRSRPPQFNTEFSAGWHFEKVNSMDEFLEPSFQRTRINLQKHENTKTIMNWHIVNRSSEFCNALHVAMF